MPKTFIVCATRSRLEVRLLEVLNIVGSWSDDVNHSA